MLSPFSTAEMHRKGRQKPSKCLTLLHWPSLLLPCCKSFLLSYLAGGTGWARRLAAWTAFGSRCCQVSVPICCRVQLQQMSPHHEKKAKSPWAVEKRKELEEREFLQLENKVSRQFHHAVSGHAAAMRHQATCLATLLMQCRRKQEEMDFWYANYPPKTWSIK